MVTGVQTCALPIFEATSATACQIYTERRRSFLRALAERGIEAHGRSGLNVWVNVREEARAARALVDAGWLVLPGERFRIATPPGLRVTVTTLLEDEAAEIAGVIAAAENLGRPRRSY